MAQKKKHTMGERLSIRFNRKIKLEFYGARLTSDGGLLAYRELDDAFAKPEIYEYLEEKGLLYAIRLPANDFLYDEIKNLLTRPVGRPSRRPVVWFHDFKYRAASWQKKRRVVAKVEWHQ